MWLVILALVATCGVTAIPWIRSSRLLWLDCSNASVHRGAVSAPTSSSAAGALPQRSRVALIHKAYGTPTMRALATMAAACHEVEGSGGWYAVVYSTHPGGAALSATQQNSLAVLRAMLGSHRVFEVGTSDIEAQYGAKLLAEQKRIFGSQLGWATLDTVNAAW